MSPIKHFEDVAHSLWTSGLTPETKAVRFYSLADSIDRYVRRARLARDPDQTRDDLWAHSSSDRALAYLTELARDCRLMGSRSAGIETVDSSSARAS